MSSRLKERVAAWGPSSLSYFALAIGQAVIGWTMRGPLSYLTLGLAISSALLALIHKGVSFDQAKRGGLKTLALPWSRRATQLMVCGVFVFLSCQTLATPLLSAPDLAYPAAMIFALAGWLASLAPKPSASSKP